MDKKTLENNQPTTSASCSQFLAAFTALLGALCMGTVLSYTSPAIPSMQNETTTNTTFNRTGEHHAAFLNKNDTELISWIISIICIGGFIGSLLGKRLSFFNR